jgi:hypothetical protein
MDADLQNELVKNGEVQREKIDDEVEKFLEASHKGYLLLLFYLIIFLTY